MRDFKLSRLLQCIRHGEGAPTQWPTSACLREPFDTWTSNVEHGYALFLFPITALFLQTVKQSVADRLFREKYGIDSPPETMDDATAKELDKRFRAFFSKLAEQASNNISSTIKLITEYGFGHLQEVLDTARIVPVVGAGVVEQGVDALLYSLVTGAWSSFETLASELWEGAVNAHPQTLAYLRGRTQGRFTVDSSQKAAPSDQGRTIRLDDLERFNYAISEKMGTIHVEAGKVSFDSLSGIREAYAAAFSSDYTSIDDPLKYEILDVASQVRHVIVHRAGKIDEDYLRKTQHLTTAPTGEVNQTLQLDGEVVAAQLSGLLSCGTELTAAVDSWLQGH